MGSRIHREVYVRFRGEAMETYLGNKARRCGLSLQNVVLSEAELQELMMLFPWDYQKRIDHLSVYMKSSGKEYQNHFATICLWAERDGTRAGMDKYEFQEGESL